MQLELGASSSVGLGRQFHIDGGLFVKFAFRVTVEEQQYIFSASCLEYVSQWMSSIEQAIPRNILPNPSKSTRKKKTLNKIKAKSGQISGKLFSRSGQTPVGCKSNFSELSTETLDFKDNPKFLALCDKSPQKLSPSDLQQIEQLLQIVGFFSVIFGLSLEQHLVFLFCDTNQITNQKTILLVELQSFSPYQSHRIYSAKKKRRSDGCCSEN